MTLVVNMLSLEISSSFGSALRSSSVGDGPSLVNRSCLISSAWLISKIALR